MTFKIVESLSQEEREVFEQAVNKASGSPLTTMDLQMGMEAVKKKRKKTTQRVRAYDTDGQGMPAVGVGAGGSATVAKSKLDGIVDGFKDWLFKAFGDTNTDVAPTVEVTKALDVEQRRAMFVALAPNEVDAHGDINTEEAVEKACISFNTMCNKANLFHRVMTQDAVIEQSYITPVGFTTDSGIEVKKGSWVQWWHFPEGNPNADLMWKMVKDGEIQGISVGATMVYEEINND